MTQIRIKPLLACLLRDICGVGGRLSRRLRR
jgi:hypothetical protein